MASPLPIPRPMAGLTVLLTALAFITPTSPLRAELMPYPPTPTSDVVDDFHGTPVPDPYRWLEDAADPAVQTWITAQGEYTRAYLDALPGQAELRAQFDELWQFPLTFGVRLRGDRLFWSRRDALQDQPVIYTGLWDSASLETGDVFLDPNTLSEDGTVALDWMHPSRDGSLVAYGLSEGGTERSTLYVRHVVTGEQLADVIPHTRASSVAWLPEGSGFYYSRLPAPGSVPEGEESFHRRVYFHALGTDPADDPLVFGAELPKETWTWCAPSHDHTVLFAGASLDWAKNDLYMRPMTGPIDAPWIPIAVGLDGSTNADVAGGTLIIHTNVRHPRYHVLAAPVAAPDQRTEIIPEGSGVIEQVELVDGHLALLVLQNASHRLLLYTLTGELVREFELPALGTISGLTAHETRPLLLFSFTSFAYAPAVIEADVRTGELTVRTQLAVPLDWDSYEVTQEWATSRDGTQVPMFVVSLKGLARDGNNPTILYGYGGFNNAQTPYFSRGALPWLAAGGVYVYTNLRGGGEFGKEWHEAGRLERKQNTYDDFIACAEHLFATGLTRPERMAISGGSNGGLLVGAVMTQRPELCRAVICAVPLLDMLRYHHFLLGRLWIPEYGDPDNPEHFPFIHAYSPYHHLHEGVEYPAVLFLSGDQDSRVDPLHARKMAARMQALGGSRPVLLRVELKAGHGQGAPLWKIINEQVDLYTFLAEQLAVAPFPAASALVAAGPE